MSDAADAAATQVAMAQLCTWNGNARVIFSYRNPMEMGIDTVCFGD